MKSTIQVNQSVISLWWSKVGKWQVLATVITLATFFITLYITGNKVIAGYAAYVAAFVVVIAGYAAVVAAGFATGFAAYVAAGFTAAALAGKEVKREISKKVTWLSYGGQFILVLAPMLIAILH